MRLLLACILLTALPIRAAAEPESAPAAALQDERVVEVSFEGRALDEAVRQRFGQLKGRPFRAAELRALLLWVHEHGGESLVEVSADSVRGGVRVRVKASQRSKIESLAFEGNSAVSSIALQPVTELKEGYDFEPSAAAEAVRKIGLFYSKQGYLSMDVSYVFDAPSGRLLFKIAEGEPTLLASLGISPLEVIERKDLRARYERDVRDLFGLKVGDRIQRERVLEGMQAVKDWLRDHDFLMAKDPALEYRVNERGEVGLFLNIQYGSRIRFGFRGNTHFSYRELMTMVGEIKEVSSGADYLVSVRRRVVEAYRAIGFANAQISTLVREDPAQGIRHVSLIVNEGEKTPITSIRIEGVYSMPEDEAIRRFQSFGTRLVQRSFFDEEGVNKAAELFAEYLKSTGYLSAKVELVKFDFNESRTKVALSLLFNEGIRTQLQEVKVSGAHSIPEPEVVQLLGLKQGEPFDIFAFERGLVDLKENYRDLGHLNAQITNESADNIVRYSRDNSQVFIELEIDEGPLFKVGEVTVRGNQKTHARVVLRELPFLPGDILTAPLLNEAEDGLRRLNLFSSVTVRPVDRPGSADIKDLLVLVEEGEAGSFDIVPGFRNDLGLRLGFEFGYQNLGGWNRSVNARAVFNRRIGNSYNFPEYSFSVGFREPYLANWPVALTSNLSVFRRQFPSFDADVSRITVGVRRDLTRYLSGLLEYGFERVKITNAKAPYSKEKDERLDFIGSVTPGFIFDSRNDQFNPTRGFQSVSRFEVASRFFGSKESVGYYRFTSFNTAYVGLFDWAVLGLGMNWGWARSNVLNERIPTFKLFRLGGIGSIRGYAEEQIVVETKNDITGVLGSFNPRAELRIPLAGNVGTALFVDAGNLYIDRFTFQPNKMRSSYGLGLRYTTPVGPVTLDFAWKMQRDDQVGDTIVNDSGSDPMRIHFSIGNF